MYINKKKQETDAATKRMLAFYGKLQNMGAEFLVDGEAMRLQDVKSNVLREDSVYMADYVTDEHGEIVQVRFDKVDTE